MTEKTIQNNLNDDVNVQIHEKSPCMVELEVFLPPAYSEKARKIAIKKISKELNIPGFRPGKAPESVVLKDHKSRVDAEMHRAIGDVGFEAISTKEVPHPLSRETKIIFDVKKLDPENESIVTFTYEVEPKVPPIDLKKFHLNAVASVIIDDEKVNEAIRQMRFFYAQWKTVNRPIKEGDYVILDIDSLEQEPAINVFSDIRFEISEKGMAKWMLNLILGLKEGEAKEGISEADDTMSAEEKAEFAPRKVRVTVKKIEEADLPDLDEAFAEKVGSQTVAELTESVKNMLQKRADEQVLSQKKEQINRFLLDEAKFDVPGSQLEEEFKHRFTELQHMDNFKENWGKSSPEEKKHIQDDIRKESEESIRLFYIARQVVRENKIPVTEDEWKNEAVATLRAQSVSGNALPDMSQMKPEVMALALSKVILAKAQHFLLEMGTTSSEPTKEATPPAEETEAPKEEEKKEPKKARKPKKTS